MESLALGPSRGDIDRLSVRVMSVWRIVRRWLFRGVLLAAIGLVYGCVGWMESMDNMHCDTAGSGYKCTQVEEAPPRHTRSEYQPLWADEYHDVGTERPEVSEYVFEMTNQEREQRGRSSLRHDPTLSQIACWHNQDQLKGGYMGHEDSDDRMAADRVAREHRRLIGVVAENVHGFRIDVESTGTGKREWASRIVDGWMESSGHRSNILDRDHTHLGVCVSTDTVKFRAVQLFAEVSAYLDQPLPWTMPPGDSMSVSFSLVKADEPPARYEFAPAGEPLREAGVGKPVNGILHVPDSTGKYGLRVLVPDGSGRYWTYGGPRVWVKEEDVPAY